VSEKYKDRFSEAEKELTKKSAFVCEVCDTKYRKKEAAKKDNTCCGRTMKEVIQESFGP